MDRNRTEAGATRADRLVRAGQLDDTRLAYQRALKLTTKTTERRFLKQRHDTVGTDAS